MRQLKITKSITNRDHASLDKFLQEISKIDLLTPQEEVSLVQKARKGDKAAFDKLVNANLRFVVSVAKQYQNNGLSLPDLISIGNQGLIIAAEKFDETRGFKFISYAVWWIRQKILQELAEHARIVRLPLNVIGRVKKVKDFIESFQTENEREPSDEEIAEELGIRLFEARSARKNLKKHLSIETPIGADDHGNVKTFLDILSSNAQTDERTMNESLKKEICISLSLLNPRERDIINLSFGLNGDEPQSLEQIGKHVGLTKERVRQIRERAIKKLKGHSLRKMNNLKSYL